MHLRLKKILIFTGLSLSKNIAKDEIKILISKKTMYQKLKNYLKKEGLSAFFVFMVLFGVAFIYSPAISSEIIFRIPSTSIIFRANSGSNPIIFRSAAKIYTCSAKPATGTSWNTVSSYTQTWNGSAWSPVNSTTEYNITADTNSCRYTCATNYTWSGLICIANTQTYTCSAKPATTIWNTVSSYTQTWNGSAWSPANSTTAYNTTADTTSCRYTCATNYIWNGSTCVYNCGTATVTDADGNVYGTVTVGTQCWLASNLKVGTKLASGGTMPANNGIIEKWCYDNSDANCTAEGGLYHWDEAMQYSTTEGVQGICPTGWHIPTDAQQYVLESYLATSACSATRSDWSCDPAGTKLKTGGTSGMNFPLAGYRNTDGSFAYRTTYANVWSSSQGGANAWGRVLNSSYAAVYRVHQFQGVRVFGAVSQGLIRLF